MINLNRNIDLRSIKNTIAVTFYICDNIHNTINKKFDACLRDRWWEYIGARGRRRFLNIDYQINEFMGVNDND